MKHDANHNAHQLHHGKPVTRRDFLSTGMIGFLGVASLPSLVRQAAAKAVIGPLEETAPYALPMMVFDMAGGASLPANFLVGGMGGSEDLLGSYDLLGWNPRETSSLDKQFGIPMSAKYSMLLKGILDNTTPAARANLRMGGICHFAQDDSSSNQLNAASLVLKSGALGSKLANGMGMENSVSGGNSDTSYRDVKLKPTPVTNLNDYIGALSFGGEFARGFLNEKMLRAIASSSKALAEIQAKALMTLPGGDVFGQLSKDAYGAGQKLIDSASGLDPRVDPIVARVYKLAANTSPDSREVIGAILAQGTLIGVSGPSTYTIGGCDYHDGSQTTGDAKDLEMGIKIGQAVQLAYELKRPLFFQLITDGGCDAAPGTRKWRGDSGDKCMTVLGFYHPTAAPRVRKTQVGYYTSGQGAERTTLLGSSPQLVGYATFANYLNCMGRLGEFHSYLPEVFKEPGQLDSVLVFEGAPA